MDGIDRSGVEVDLLAGKTTELWATIGAALTFGACGCTTWPG